VRGSDLNRQYALGDEAGWSFTSAGSVIVMADDRPVLNQINLVVRDMDAMIEFYPKLGAEVAPTAPPWDRHHRTVSMPDGLDFDLDSTDFARSGIAAGRPARPDRSSGFEWRRERQSSDLRGPDQRWVRLPATAV
jgi:hypothetical protein